MTKHSFANDNLHFDHQSNCINHRQPPKNKWSLKKLNIALQKLNEFDKEIKKNFNQNNDIMLKQLLINLCNIVVNPLKV